jgi:cytolysin (calcineurin-like family phosphatase)
MNRLPGTALPRSIGGRVDRPLGVLVAGDLTDRGKPEQWRTFVKYFGRTGRDGVLKYPVYLATGNHDRKGSRKFVLRQVRARHGALAYSWNWHGVQFVCLDNYPGRRNLIWLKKDLSALRPRTPVVIFFHYSILGPFSQWWGKKAKNRFRKAIQRHNVIAIFHGHYHGAGHYRWAGFDVYNVGSPLYYFVSFAVARITAHHLSVASWNYEHGRWSWSHLKRLRPGPDPKLLPAK